jgi:hypothetical protein
MQLIFHSSNYVDQTSIQGQIGQRLIDNGFLNVRVECHYLYVLDFAFLNKLFECFGVASCTKNKKKIEIVVNNFIDFKPDYQYDAFHTVLKELKKNGTTVTIFSRKQGFTRTYHELVKLNRYY